MKISVLILTLNEEINIGACIDSLAWCNDIVVLDSFSEDRTVDIAEAKGARVFRRRFDDYASQRNFGLKGITYSHRWVLMVDADEIVSDGLAREIEAIDETVGHVCMYCMRRKDFFRGKWLRRSSGYPTWFGRLVVPGRVVVKRAINEEYHTDGETAFLQHHLLHYPFKKGMAAWLDKHNRYSSMEAEALGQREEPLPVHNLFSRDPVLRRKAIKRWVYRLPMRPVIVFMGLYFVKRGILDGAAGLSFCLLRAFYEYLIDLKAIEQCMKRLNQPF
jgi:glycosyltransferase involved in cell wall biosynthesis